MNCRAVQEELELFVLGDVCDARAREVAAHLGACAACRAAEQEYRLVLGRLRAAPPSAPRPEFAAALGASVGRAIAGQRRRFRRVAAVAAAVAALAAGVGVLMLRGRTPAAPEQWRYGQVQAVPASAADGVVVHDHSMYVLRADGRGLRIVAVDAATGAARWEAAGESVGYLAADTDHVYCLASPGRGALALVALDAATGREQWRYEQPWPHPLREPSRPVPLTGGRVCWSADGVLHVLDAATGKPRWTHVVAEGRPLSPAVASGADLFVVSPAALHCLAGATGDELWQQGLGEAVGGGRPLLAIDGGRAYIARPRPGSGADVFCLDLATRALVWRRAAPAARFLLAADGVVCLRGGSVTAIDAATGGMLWSRRAEGCGPLTWFDGRLHLVDSAEPGRVVALEPRTGRAAWELSGFRSCDAFARVGDLGYVKTRDGVVHALALARARF